jgi:short-subunit dehydrogenase
MGKAVARRLAERGDRLFLFGRNEEALARTAADLKGRGAEGDVGTARVDLLVADGFKPALYRARAEMGRVDTIVVTAALFASQDALEADADLTEQLLTANFVRTIQFCEEARRVLLDDGGGTLCVFSSVAGERGRKPVVLYGASKAGLSAYLNGLDARFRDAGLRTVIVKPGFVKTDMTEGLTPPPFSGEPDEVAARVVSAIDRGKAEVYAPAMWRWVMTVIRALPRFVMRRVKF